MKSIVAANMHYYFVPVADWKRLVLAFVLQEIFSKLALVPFRDALVLIGGPPGVPNFGIFIIFLFLPVLRV